MNKIAVGVLGASGYAGRELCTLVARHPAFDLAFATAHSRAGERFRIAGGDLTLIAAEDAPLSSADLVFSALPHGTSAQWVAASHAAGAKVIDLSADLRPGNRVGNHDASQGASDSTYSNVPYGLTELMRAKLAGAEVVANPGCYPTAILIGLAPLLRRGLVVPGATIHVSAASGVTGAGANPKAELMFAEVAEDFRAYAVGNAHRHMNEMQVVIRELGGDNDLIFTPHLLPVARGILATMTVPVTDTVANPLSLWHDLYKGEPFVEISDTVPSLRDVVYRNAVRVSAMYAVNVRQSTMIVIAAIDNLVKGAAGQAVQNANVLFGLDETTGLPA